MESHARSIVKTVSYRIFSFFLTAFVVLAITGRPELAATVGLADTVVKLGAFYLHERWWNRIAYGRQAAGDYEI